MSDKSKDPDFLCPQCGSSYFRTSQAFDGYGVAMPGSAVGCCRNCPFRWNRNEVKAERRAFPKTTAKGLCWYGPVSDECGRTPVATIGWTSSPADGTAWRACELHARNLADSSYWTRDRGLPVYWDKDLLKKSEPAPIASLACQCGSNCGGTCSSRGVCGAPAVAMVVHGPDWPVCEPCRTKRLFLVVRTITPDDVLKHGGTPVPPAFEQRAEAAGWKLVENKIHRDPDGSGGWCCDLPGHTPRSKGGEYGVHAGPEVWRDRLGRGLRVACTPCLRALLDAKSPEPPKPVEPPPKPELERCVACHAEEGFVVLRSVAVPYNGSVDLVKRYCADCAPEGHLRPTCAPTQAQCEADRRSAQRLVLSYKANRLGLTAPEVLRPARGWDARYAL